MKTNDAHSRLPGLEVGYQYEVKQDPEVGYYVDVEILCYRFNGPGNRSAESGKKQRQSSDPPILAEEIRQAFENEASRWLGT
jgi:hypothetical protein